MRWSRDLVPNDGGLEKIPVCQPPVQDAGFPPRRLRVKLGEGSRSRLAGPAGQKLALRQCWMRIFYFCCSQSFSRALQASCSPFCSLGLQKPTHRCPLWDTRPQRAGRCQRHHFCWQPHLGSLWTTITVLSDTGFSGMDSALIQGAARHPGLTPSACPIPLAIWMDRFRDGQ